MKKLMIVTIALFLVAILYSSCKIHETCPAYGSVEAENSEKYPS